MPKTITTFHGFVKHVATLILGLVLLAALVGLSLFYVFYSLQGLTFSAIFTLLMAQPAQLIQLSLQMMTTEPTKTIFQMTTFPGFTFTAIFAAVFMIYLERKLIAKMQLRVGPQYAGRFEGIGQTFADLFKLVFKEIIVPNSVDKPFYWAAPFALMAVAGSLLALLPVGPNTYIANPPVGVLLAFAIIGFSPLVALLAGWASNNKFSFLGGLRALHQLVSYEIPMIVSVLGVVLLSGSLSLVSIASAQGSVWFILLQPLGAIVFFTAALAELERIPFDLPEADSELVAGWQTEYGGMLFGVFQLGTYVKFYAIAGLFTTFFLGGWYGPGPVPPEVWFVLKAFVVMVLMMIPRGVMGRVRIDFLLRAGWTRLMVLSFANLFIAMLLISLGLVQMGGH